MIKCQTCDTRNWSIRKCALNGKVIYPFTKMLKCRSCKKVYHLSSKGKIPANCGVEELDIYMALEDVNVKRHDKMENARMSNEVEVSLVYGKIPLKVKPEDVAKGALAGSHDNVLNRIDKNLVHDASIRRRRTMKKVAESAYNSFHIYSVLGQGSFGKVLLATYKTNASKDKFVT